MTAKGEYGDMVKVSANEGKPGDKVTFEVGRNYTEEETVFEYLFATETAEADFRITLMAGELPYITLDSGNQVNLTAVPGKFNLDITTNVVDIVPVISDDWIRYVARTDAEDGKSTLMFSYDAFAESGERTAVITLPVPGNENGVKVDVTQNDVLVGWAAKMDNARFYSEWPNRADFTDMETFSVEMLVYPDGMKGLSSLFGVEGCFVLRCGDGIGTNEVEAVLNTTGEEEKFRPKGFALQDKTWNHVVFTFDKGKMTAYLDGELKGDMQTQSSKITLATDWVDESGWGSKRNFWLGYAVEPARTFEGMMCEVRVWNKILTADDLIGNHKYYVDPMSENLIAYWRFDDGEGSKIVTDHSKNANHLIGQINVSGDVNGAKGDAGINWSPFNIAE